MNAGAFHATFFAMNKRYSFSHYKDFKPWSPRIPPEAPFFFRSAAFFFRASVEA
jgi:hypothetical protein